MQMQVLCSAIKVDWSTAILCIALQVHCRTMHCWTDVLLYILCSAGQIHYFQEKLKNNLHGPE